MTMESMKKKTERTPEDNQRAQLENEIARLNKKIAKYEAIDLKQNNYGLVFLDVPEAFDDDVENKLPILEEVPKLAINSKDGKPIHLLIEGDNYHVLTCLNYTHKGKVDVIYIDPPYNTGSDGFKYKDKRILDKYPDGTEVPIDHPLRHSYWLSFMRKRLELARDILSDTGVIFISIDDNEFAQLKLVCDDIFTENNFVGIFTWTRKKKGSHLSNEIRKMTEYVIAYRKKNVVELFGENAYKDKWQPLLKRTNSKKTLALKKGVVEATIPNGKYKKGNYGTGGTQITLENDIFVENGTVVTDFSITGRYVWTQNMLDEELSKGTRISINSEGFGFNVLRWDQAEKTKRPSTLINGQVGVGTNEDANEEIKKIFNLRGDNEIFKYAKPVSLIRYLVLMASKNNKSAIVADFFAGSGTTGQAVMELNDTDTGNRQFILVTNNDEITNGQKHKIMTDICYPRIKNVIKGYNGNKGLGNSIKYFKTAFVGKNNILQADDRDKIELAYNAGGMLAIAENTFEQVEKTDCWQIFESEKRYTAIYFREEFSKFDDFVERVKKLKKPASVYVFSWEKEMDFEEFEDYKNIAVKTIPQPILEIYKQIYNLV